MGDRHAIPKDIQRMMQYSERITRKKHRVLLNIAVNYGSRQEILHGVQALAHEVEKGRLRAKDITEQMLSDHLYTAALPDPDLIIRPSGEYRLSNFLLWQAAYAELWFTDTLWPDFTEEDFVKALRAYEHRNRRFGGV